MTNILDRITSARYSFRPQTSQEFFALQLARKLQDVERVHTYVVLADAYAEELLLTVYRDTLDHGRGDDMAQRFHTELRRRLKKERYEE